MNQPQHRHTRLWRGTWLEARL